MIRIISALVLTVAATLCNAASDSMQLADQAPSSHTVVRGDTLWDISARFLKEPWRWPEIWRMNKEQIRNPHRIYPGDVIVLSYDADGKPRLSIQENNLQPKIYSRQIDDSIPSIAPNFIEPFLSTPLIVEADGLDNAASIVSTQQDRVYVGNGDVAYVKNAGPAVRDWQVYRNGKALLDPTNPDRVLGYEAFYLGTAKQTRPGEPATFEILIAKQEIGRGDRLLPAAKPVLVDYVPHKPDTRIDGNVISVYGGVGVAGRGSIVSINRSTSDGIEIGHILALERNRTVFERTDSDHRTSLLIPAERVGLIFVFRSFKNISYALVVQSTGTIEDNDFVRTP